MLIVDDIAIFLPSVIDSPLLFSKNSTGISFFVSIFTKLDIALCV